MKNIRDLVASARGVARILLFAPALLLAFTWLQLQPDAHDTAEPWCLKIDEVARRLSISRSKTYVLIRLGVIPSIRLGGGNLRVPTKQLAELLERQAREANDQNATLNEGDA